jgi:hypothetical protein
MSRSSRRNRPRRPARIPPIINPRKRILALCEGKVTEPHYLRDFARVCRHPLVAIEVSKEHGVPLTLVHRAKELRDEADALAKREKDDNLKFDEVWCVFDVDEHPNLAEAKDVAQRAQINLAISNPCFELWFYLHFFDSPGAQDRHAIQKMFRRCCPDYEKRVEYGVLSPGYELAVERATRLADDAFLAEEAWRNPTTGVFLLTESIRAKNL